MIAYLNSMLVCKNWHTYSRKKDQLEVFIDNFSKHLRAIKERGSINYKLLNNKDDSSLITELLDWATIMKESIDDIDLLYNNAELVKKKIIFEQYRQ
jgi:hypothetical protein